MLTIWHNPRCRKSRETLNLIEDAGAELQIRRYLEDVPSASEIKEILILLGLNHPRTLMRRGDRIYKELGLKDVAEAKILIQAMVDYPILNSGDHMRLGSLTLSATFSAVLLSGCSFIGGQSSKHQNPYAKQKSAGQGYYAQQGQYGQPRAGQHCQIATPRQPIPRGCRPEQVTIGTPTSLYPQAGYAAQSGFPQQPSFGEPQYTNGGYGQAVGKGSAVGYHASGPKKRKPKLRGFLSLGAERSVSGDLITVTYTANDFIDAQLLSPQTVRTPGVESTSAPAISFDDVWSAPVGLKGGLEYIVNDKTTVFAAGGYTHAKGNESDFATVTATLYREEATQNFRPALDDMGAPIQGAFIENGDPEINYQALPNQRIASFAYDFSDLERYDLEVGVRRYLKPLVQSEGYKTVTPFVGASIGASHVNAVDFEVSQTQSFYQTAFDSGGENPGNFSVSSNNEPIRVYDSQWLPQGQLNVGGL